MTKHYTHHQHNVMHDIECMSIEELEQQYDIEVDTDGTVWDHCEGKEFLDLQAWGLFVEKLEAEDVDEYEPIIRTGKRRSDDDY
jgi:hypothetical protein